MHWDARQHPQRDEESEQSARMQMSSCVCHLWSAGTPGVMLACPCWGAPLTGTWVHQQFLAPEGTRRFLLCSTLLSLSLLPPEIHSLGSLGDFFLFFFPNVVVIPNVKVPNMFLLSNLQMFCVIFAASFSGLCLCPPAFLPWIIESWRCACSIPVSGPKWEWK